MNSTLILAPVLGAGIGLAAAYAATHKPFRKRIHFVKRENLQSELENLDINVEEGERCVDCGERIKPEEIGAVVREGNEYKIVGNKPECLDTYEIRHNI